MIAVFRIPLSKQRLAKLPPGDRRLLIVAGHSVNQITTLIKLLTLSTNHNPGHPLENKLSSAQSQVILRFLFGALAETWEYLRKQHRLQLIGLTYLPLLDTEGRKRYDVLNKQFGKSSLLHNIRNLISYHHPNDHIIDEAFKDAPTRHDWAFYASTANTNSFYLASDLMISTAVMRRAQATGKVSTRKGTEKVFKRVMDETINVANNLVEFLLFLMEAIYGKHIDIRHLSPRTGSGMSCQSLTDLRFPFSSNRIRHSRPPCLP
jgi:hypothetical protein